MSRSWRPTSSSPGRRCGRPGGGSWHAACRRTRSSPGSWRRTTLIEFDSVQDAVAAYESPAYQEALRVLDDGAERDLRIIEAAS